MKWSLGVHKRCSNLACYGDTGRFPLAIPLAKQLLGYYQRLKSMDRFGTDSLARHAFCEQRDSELDWFKKITSTLRSIGLTDSTSPIILKNKLQNMFNELWREGVNESPKLRFYQKCKQDLSAGRSGSSLTSQSKTSKTGDASLN